MEQILQTKQTVQVLADSLKGLMGKMPLRKITVQDITENCSLNRHTFYYHFKDIYDLLSWIYTNELFHPIKYQPRDWHIMMQWTIQYIKDNQPFVRNTVCSLPRRLLKQILFPYICQWVSLILSENCHADLDQDKEKFLIHFFADAFLDSILRWVETDLRESEESLLQKAELIQKILAEAKTV